MDEPTAGRQGVATQYYCSRRFCMFKMLKTWKRFAAAGLAGPFLAGALLGIFPTAVFCGRRNGRHRRHRGGPEQRGSPFFAV